MPRPSILIASAALALLPGCDAADQRPSAGKPSPNDWLLAAESDEARLKLIQRQMRGFDQPMWEVGERFERLHGALERGNYDLAVYHWEKIRTTIENGIAKRPARRTNSEALFLNDDVWQEAKSGFGSRDAAKAWGRSTSPGPPANPATRPSASIT
ncbi:MULTISPECIES: hypothetical protein [unclassified Phenylobacterium]|jgi:hypothetical protein|uniref:hypothetical protein n=1 Tax=unclassified Phenylobacterium TaxID=2640670 RepID=UPI00083B1CAB|nr:MULTISPECIES: hypothetical protein [unclassified Phenylobacterium]